MEILLTVLAEITEKKAAVLRKEAEYWDSLAKAISVCARNSVSTEKQKQDEGSPKTNFLTVRQLAERYPAFTANGIRHHIFHAEKNGFTKCMRRVGKRVLIEESLFVQWIASNGGVRRS